MNLDALRLTSDTKAVRASSRPPRPRAGEHFLKGPVPLDWLRVSANQPGKSMAVAVYIWYMAGLKGTNNFAIPTTKLEMFGVSRFALYRALSALMRAGLILVERHRGRHAVISILSTPRASESDGGGK